MKPGRGFACPTDMGNRLCVCLLFCLTPVLGFAENWSGILVDSKCYDSEERNVNPWEPYHDQALDVRLCHPNAHTKSFAIVQADWLALKLDSSANAQAAELVRKADKKPYLGVVVTGERNKDTVRVETISAAK
jgi:hypothetical protein